MYFEEVIKALIYRIPMFRSFPQESLADSDPWDVFTVVMPEDIDDILYAERYYYVELYTEDRLRGIMYEGFSARMYPMSNGARPRFEAYLEQSKKALSEKYRGIDWA